MIIWETFSVFYYGFPVPNTFYAKLNNYIPAAQLSQQGLFYIASAINSDPITIMAIFSGIVLAVLDKNTRHILVGLGVIFYLVYVVKIGGDWMAGRFLTLPLITAVCIIINRDFKSTAEYYVLLVAAILIGMISPYPTLTSDSNYGSGRQDTIDRWGIFDERAVCYPGAGLLQANRFIDMPNNGSVLKGIQLQGSGQTIAVMSAIGYTGFYAGRGVHIIDDLGLSDPLLARLKPVPKAYWFVATFTRLMPDGYGETITSGKNKIVNKDLAAYYDKLSHVISGKLTDPSRLVDIWKLNLGYYNHLLIAYEDSLLLHVSVPDINNKGVSSLPHDQAGNIVFPVYGITIALDQPSHSRHISITLQDTTTYFIVFSRNGHEIGRQLFEGTHSDNLDTKIIGVPIAAVKKGFDEVTVLPSAEGGTYLLGGFELKP
jgi:arabinofuranosyltransferase